MDGDKSGSASEDIPFHVRPSGGFPFGTIVSLRSPGGIHRPVNLLPLCENHTRPGEVGTVKRLFDASTLYLRITAYLQWPTESIFVSIVAGILIKMVPERNILGVWSLRGCGPVTAAGSRAVLTSLHARKF